jgi:hypothetical protein
MKRNYRILIIAVRGLVEHVSRFISNLKAENPSVEIYLLINQKIDGLPKDILDNVSFYMEFQNNGGNLKGKFLSLISLNKAIKTFSRIGHFDIINIHFPVHDLCFYIPRIKRMCSSLVVSPWGSDVLRVHGWRWRVLVQFVLKKADYLTVVNNGMIEKRLLNETNIDSSRFVSLAWGSETIDYIIEHKDSLSREQAKANLGLENSYIITCGYNAFRSQQHLMIIEQLSKVSSLLPPNTVLVFPVTYGGINRKPYIEQIKNCSIQLGIKTVFFEDYLSLPELYVLRRSSDMFIHVQTTDAGNTSLQEYVLCGSKIVQGSWNTFYDLENYKPLFYYPVDSLDGLGEVVVKAIQSEPIQVPIEVINIFMSAGWKERIKKWDLFFQELAIN